METTCSREQEKQEFINL